MTVQDAEYILDDSAENAYSDNKTDSDEEDVYSSNKESDAENESGVNAGWADSVAKILSSKKPKRKKSLVLSKAKKLSDVVVKRDKPEKIGFEIEGEVKEEKPDLEEILPKTEVKEPAQKIRKKEKSSVRVKPNILDKDRERTLAKIATRGVVQLFNSVRMQQKDINNKLNSAGSLIRKRENVMKSIDKRAFLDVLMGEKSQLVDGPVKDERKQENNEEVETKSTWNVLREDFMMGAKFKDWDIETDVKDESLEEVSDSD